MIVLPNEEESALIFKHNASDGSIGVYRGGKTIPEEPTDTTNYYRDDFDSATLDETNRWVKSVTGSGSVSISSGICSLETGTTNGSTVQIKHKLAKNLTTYSVLRMRGRIKVTMSATTACRFYLGLYSSSEAKYARIVHLTSDAVNEIESSIEDGTGEAGSLITKSFDGVYVTWEVYLNQARNLTIFGDSANLDSGTYTSLITDDLYLVARIENNAAANQKMEIDYIELIET